MENKDKVHFELEIKVVLFDCPIKKYNLKGLLLDMLAPFCSSNVRY